MLRALLLLLAFALVSPVIRGYVFDAYSALDTLVRLHTTAAFVATGVIGFSSFLFLRLTARR